MLTRKAEMVDLECVVRGLHHRLGLEGLPEDRRGLRLRAPVRAARGPAAARAAVHAVHEGARPDTTRTSPSRRRRRSSATPRSSTGSPTSRSGSTRTPATTRRRKGIILADTKFEFGLVDGELTLCDEAFTPDSSRYWPADEWEPGTNPPSFDKQYVRDYAETVNWNKDYPGPELPDDVVEGTRRALPRGVRAHHRRVVRRLHEGSRRERDQRFARESRRADRRDAEARDLRRPGPGRRAVAAGDGLGERVGRPRRQAPRARRRRRVDRRAARSRSRRCARRSSRTP